MPDTTDAAPAPDAQPLISVLIPAYNHARFVRAALDSVLQQSWRNLELIVIDDASPDATWQVLQKCTDPRVRLSRNERNLGSHGTLNAALQQARGEFVTSSIPTTWSFPPVWRPAMPRCKPAAPTWWAPTCT